MILSRFIFSIDILENLSDLKWKYRILIIFDAQNEIYLKEKMNNISKYGQEIIDRDLIIFYENNENIYYNSTLVPKSLKESIMSLASQYQIDIKMILIGKDGGVKRVFQSSDQIHEVFDLIDTMPMRKIEMRRK